MIPVSISIGLALAHPGDDVETIFSRADTALYRAKQKGGAHTAVFDEGPR